MCTLAVAWRHYPGHSLVVAANRDERLERPSSGPRIWDGERFLAPRDEVAGGTWLGVTASGMFVGVTNRFGVRRDEQRASRGALVVDALRHRGAAALHHSLSRLDPARYNAFHLLYADAGGAFVTWSDGERLQQHALSPGLHVVTERSLGGDDRERTERVQLAFAQMPDAPTPGQLTALLAQHGGSDPLGSVCVHAPEFDYGTRSSAVLFLPERLEEGRFLWAEGPPCTTTFADRSGLLKELAAR